MYLTLPGSISKSSTPVFAAAAVTYAVRKHRAESPAPEKTEQVERAESAVAAKELRTAKVGMAGYRDMNLYGTLYDGLSLKQTTGVEIETFEMLEMQQRYEKITDAEKKAVVENRIKKWHFLKPAKEESMMKAAGYYLAVKQIAEERHYKSISIKDVDGMKKLLGFPPAMVFMLLASVHFGLIYIAVVTKSFKPFKNEVFRFYLSGILVGTILVAVTLKAEGLVKGWGNSFLIGSFHILSYASTTGFAIADNSSWPMLPSYLLIFFGIRCGMAGSTTGGIKADRALLFY